MIGAQRRPGPKPRRHQRIEWAIIRSIAFAQRRPGPKPRRHRQRFCLTALACATLNEGRGLNPGDTLLFGTIMSNKCPAQRRPGPKPRRHLQHLPTLCAAVKCAQRRPGPKPRRHLRKYCNYLNFLPSLNEGRGLNPGDTRHRHSAPTTADSLNEGRGLNPGDTRGTQRG